MLWAIVPAAGCGARSGAPKNKILMPLCGVPVLVHTLRALRGNVDAVALCGAPGELALLRTLCEAYDLSFVKKILPGGQTRSQSVLRALEALAPESPDAVLIHDAARPLASPALLRACADAAAREPFAAAVPVSDTVKQVRGDYVTQTPDRAALRAAQTPQGGPFEALLSAYRAAAQDGFLDVATDDASVCEHAGLQVRLIAGEMRNLKITTPGDFITAQSLLRGSAPARPAVRVGMGLDAHRLTENRPLVLCGVTIPHDRGLLGHSDADVALHALMDALLGAAALGDIGQLFPDTDEQYRGISSLSLLARVCQTLGENGFMIDNVDVTIVAQLPKLAPYRERMRQNIALVTGLPESAVSVKATTTERMGYEGREEGISAHAVALVRREWADGRGETER